MIFSADELRLIAERRKSQLRQPVRFVREKPQPVAYKPGRLYKAHHAAGAKSTLITIVDVRQERLGDISQQDVKREGFRFLAEFKTDWARRHDVFDPGMLVWVISFAVGDLRDRFDRPRMLAATPGHVRYEEGPDGRQRIAADLEEHQDYTDRRHLGMAGESEAIPALDAAKYAKVANDRDEVIRRERIREQMGEMSSVWRRFHDALAGDGVNRDVRKTLRAIDFHRAQLERKLGEEA